MPYPEPGTASLDDITTRMVQFTFCADRGMGTFWVRCPVAVANKMVAAKKLRVGWVNTRVEALEPRLLQCYRCLEKGHVQAQCRGGTDRAACCYRCGKEGHIARDCRSAAKCPLCASLRRPDGHKAGSRACTAPKRKARDRATHPPPFPGPHRSLVGRVLAAAVGRGSTRERWG